MNEREREGARLSPLGKLGCFAYLAGIIQLLLVFVVSAHNFSASAEYAEALGLPEYWSDR